MFPKSHKGKVLNKYPTSRVRRIKAYIEAGHSFDELKNLFKLTDFEANVFYVEFTETVILVPDDANGIIGHKNQPYYKEELPEKPVYRLEDLEAEEKVISKKDTSTKLWTWEE